MLCALLTELRLSAAVGGDDCFFVNHSIQFFTKMQRFNGRQVGVILCVAFCCRGCFVALNSVGYCRYYVREERRGRFAFGRH